ncbi:hypothetical protein AHMF7605_03690 [Adhaeribacter arboris]|uniref:SPOR domain-containing protein n=1 Tax=Adhaeribacter arboris TaxID=2072846 RepID=A0A2T2YB07_9BACT|nr:hypothetical protein [Adhaeribacter arboris]PSR52689.1 hypothetical protein AHMF7605_03690 [Adhaeribacter arboris]
MTPEELQIKKFELEQKIQLEELSLKKKELELKIQEQTSRRVFTPLVISIVGGLITIITGFILKYYDNVAVLRLEDKKFQSSLLLKATDAKTYDEFSDMLLALQENGLLSLDSAKIAKFRKKRFVAEKLNQSNPTNSETVALTSESDTVVDKSQIRGDVKPLPPKSGSSVNTADTFTWIIVAGGDTNLEAARFEQRKFLQKGFQSVRVWQRNNIYRTCVGQFATYSDAVNVLFDVKEKLNNSSYLVRLDKWCPHAEYDKVAKIYVCR